MRPPTYRNADRNHVGKFLKGCGECSHERQFKGRPMCLKHLAQVRLNKTCDDWDGGVAVGHSPNMGLHGGIHYHDDVPNGFERMVLESGEITTLDDA
jgi:hypothetical protein